jgi:hypothetical protein
VVGSAIYTLAGLTAEDEPNIDAGNFLLDPIVNPRVVRFQNNFLEREL